MIIAVDFDGTLCKNAFPEIGEPKYKTIDMLKQAQKDGHVLILWTCRINQDERNYLNEAVGWCALQGLIFDYINDNPMNEWPKHPRKIYADIYLDDRALHVDQFELLEVLLNAGN